MTRTAKTTIIIISSIALIVVGGLYFFKSFFSAFAPPKVTVTKDFISTDRSFINGLTIEKIKVDSMGDTNYPIKYTVLYSTSCNIQQLTDRPTISPSKIEFAKAGKYSWDEDTVKVRYIHNGLSRQSLDTKTKLWWLNKFGKHPICPLKFEQQQWYFITLSDPQVTGIFFYIDSLGKEHQYFLASGVSPI